MSMPSASPRASVFRLAAPAGILLLTGLVLAYAYQGANAGHISPAIASPPNPAIDAMDAIPAAPVMHRLGKLASLKGAQVNSAVFADLPSALAQLHSSMAPTPATQVAERDRVVADLDSQHQAESIDALWSATSEQSVVAASVAPVMAQAGYKPQDVATDCRSRTCRISARFESSTEARGWADRLLTQMAGTISQAKVAVLPRDDGSFEVRVYGARMQP
jgi:hypothetical protein